MKARQTGVVSVMLSVTVGVVERFRAVMMTAFTFVLGILPMVWATGAGANARRSIGVTTLAGMLASTLVGVLLVPGLYVIFQRVGDWFESSSFRRSASSSAG